MEERKLIEEIRALFQQLIDEEKQPHYSPGFRSILPPSNQNYCMIAEQLVNKAHDLYNLNSQYDIRELDHILEKEVEYVRLHQFKYDRNGKETSSSINELKCLMHKANSLIRRYFWDVLGDIQC